MPIKITQFDTQPAIAYDEVHVGELRITLDEAQNPKALVRVTYKLIGRDAEGIKHFAREQHVAVIEDAYVAAYEQAMQGDMTLATALQSIESALAAILTQQGTLGTASPV